MLAGGTTPTAASDGLIEAPGAATGPAFGPGDATTAGEAAAAGAAAAFFSSRLSELSDVLLCAYKTDKVNVSTKKIPANQPVIFVRTVVVCAPKIFSVIAPPNAAPRPSLFGRCIRITRIMSKATIIQITKSKLIKIAIGSGEYGQTEERSKRPTRNVQWQKFRTCFDIGR